MSLHGQTQGEGSPGERAVEALRFSSRRPRAHKRGRNQLHICDECASDLVYPTDWAPADEHHWHLVLRCPECEWRGTGVHNQDVVDRFDIELDRGVDSVIDDLNTLARSNMEEEVERFLSALRADQILPEDF